jgi:serine/threonine-protein phosphatase 2A regulatory subunit A
MPETRNYTDLNALLLLKEEFRNDEVHLKVNAVHRLKTVIMAIGGESTIKTLIPYIDQIIDTEDDEVLYAVAEELGKIFEYVPDKLVLLPLLEKLAMSDETVVREEAIASLIEISKKLT